jgi:hypothetical protein
MNALHTINRAAIRIVFTFIKLNTTYQIIGVIEADFPLNGFTALFTGIKIDSALLKHDVSFPGYRGGGRCYWYGGGSYGIAIVSTFITLGTRWAGITVAHTGIGIFITALRAIAELSVIGTGITAVFTLVIYFIAALRTVTVEPVIGTGITAVFTLVIYFIAALRTVTVEPVIGTGITAASQLSVPLQ